MRFPILIAVLLLFVEAHAVEFGIPFCEQNRDCPGWITQLQSNSPLPYVCSAFLIQPDVVMTNRHCLQEALRKPGSACQGIQFSFPSTPQFPSEKVNCKTVLQTSDSLQAPVKWVADMALLLLEKPVHRSVLEISSEILQESQSLDVLKVDPAPMGKNTPVIRKIRCQMGISANNSYFTSSPSPEMTLLNCPIISGNSGSPILNQSGKAVGLVWARAGATLPGAGSKTLDLAVATPFQCFHFATSKALQLTQVCKTSLSPAVSHQLENNYLEARHETAQEAEANSRMAQQIEKSFGVLIQKLQKEMSQETFSEARSLFDWRTRELPLKAKSAAFLWGRYSVIPACLHEDRLSAYLKNKNLTESNLRLNLPVPMANLVRVMGDPELYFTPLIESKELKLKIDSSRPASVAANVTSPSPSSIFSFSAEIEVAANQIELSVIDIPLCTQK